MCEQTSPGQSGKLNQAHTGSVNDSVAWREKLRWTREDKVKGR